MSDVINIVNEEVTVSFDISWIDMYEQDPEKIYDRPKIRVNFSRFKADVRLQILEMFI